MLETDWVPTFAGMTQLGIPLSLTLPLKGGGDIAYLPPLEVEDAPLAERGIEGRGNAGLGFRVSGLAS